MKRLATGIQGFDVMVQGGLPLGSSVVLQGPPGQEKLQFALTFLAEGLKSGASGLAVISSESPDAVLGKLRSLGVSVDKVTAEQRLRIVDWYSWSEESVLDVEERGLVIRSSVDLTNLGVALSRAIAALSKQDAPRAVIEMLSPATNVYEITQVYAFAQSAKKKFDRHGFTGLVLLEKDMHSGSQIPTLHQPFDGVIEMERTRSGDRIVRKIGVLHLKETAPDPTFRLLEIGESGMRVVREGSRPSPTTAAGSSGTVLETQEERARRLTLIMQIASERLKLNPRDGDALFAMAAAQATLDDARGGLQSLDRLAELDPNYPGLWVLKTKLHARLGEAERARTSRLRSQEAERSESIPAEATVPCPMCEAPVGVHATVCHNCGVKFTPSRKLEDELDDLEHAAIQQMVEEDFKEETSPARRKKSREPTRPEPEPGITPAPKSEPPIPRPAPKPIPKKGLTNGLVLGRGAGRRTGMTNGLRGRTNGLRGRTNGLTNGMGRTNGLTNGVGRTNGLTNGLGRTNGLTNGLGRTNGLTNGLGRTNGITNGLGRTNGLTNGLGGVRPSGFRSSGVRGMMQTAGWKLYMIPLVVVGLLLMPLFLVPEYNGPLTPIRIDGQFGDWASLSTMSMGSSGLSPNVDIIGFGMVDNLGPHAFYVQVAGTALQGGGTAPGTMDSVRIFVDTDGRPATGYQVDGLGADRLIEVSGYAGTVRSSTLWEFDANRDARDWNGWIKGTATRAAASGSQIEAEAEWLPSTPSSTPLAATVHAASWDGEADASEFPISLGGGSVSVVSVPDVPAVISGTGVSLVRLILTGHGATVSIDSLTVQIVGTAPAAAALSLRLMDGSSVIAEVTPTTRDVTFSFPAVAVSDGSTVTLSVVGDFTGTGGDTFGLQLPASHPFGIDAAAVGLRENPGARTLGYLGSVPGTPRVDGAFGEWTSLSTDADGDVTPRANPGIDLAQHGALSSGGSSYLYADVTGRIFRGTPVPEVAKPTPIQAPSTPADSDRDSVPDTTDPMPLDFNNDGVPDTNTNGDYDGDSVIDYGFVGGTDHWLNTTLPDTFPAPYAGRFVSVYIGPTERPPVLGEDAFRLFLDLDNSTASGYLISGIGADRLVDVRGKDGLVTQSALMAFSGSFPGQWAWSPVSPVTVAVGHHAAELSVPLTVANVYVEAADFWGSTDSTAASPVLAPQFMTLRGSAANGPTSVSWIQVGPQPAGTLIDGGSNSATTVYNHQRKVVRAGDTPGTACDATNSDGCWYAVFYDRTAEGGTFYFRNTNHATETACTTNKVASSTKGGGPAITATLATTQSACWYVDAMTGRIIGAGNWETRLDIAADRGVAAYGEGSQSEPRYRTWDSSAFGLESNAATAAGSIQWVVVKASPVSAEDVIMAVLSDNNNLYVQTWDGASWTARWSTAIGDSITRRFDIAFEQSSGDALVVFGDGTTQLKYRKRVGGTWDASNQNAGAALADLPYWVRAESRPTNDDVFVAVITNGLTLSAMRWNGGTNSWGDQTQMTTNPSVKDQETMDLAFDRSTGDAFVFWGDGSNNLKYREFTTSWQAEANAYAGMADKVFWIVADYDPLSSSSKMAVGMVLNNGNFEFGAFDGSAWVTRPSAVTARLKTERGIDVAFEKDTGEAVFIFDTSANPSLMSWRTWTSSGGFSSVMAEPGTTGNINTMQLKADPRSNAIMALYADANSDLFHRSWSGSSWSGVGTALETTLSTVVTMREAFMFAWTSSLPEYDVVFEIWDMTTNAVAETIGSCVDVTTYGDDTQCLISSVAEKTLASDHVVRARVAHSSASGKVRVEYDDTDSTGDSRVTLPTTQLDRIILMRSSDTSGSTWGSQIVLASGASADSPLLLTRDSAEPSIAIDSAGYLHIVWVSASAAGDQSALNLVRHTKTTVAYPTQNQLASGSNWQAITNVDDTATGFMPTVSTDSGGYPHIAWSGSKTSGTVYYKNQASGTWRSTISWGTTYTGISVDVSPQNNYVSLTRYLEAGTNEIQYTVCKDLSTSICDASAEFTKWDGTAGVDMIATAVETASYPSLVTTYEANGDVWVAYAKDVDGSTRAIYTRFLDYPSGGWVAAETVDSVSGTTFTKPSIGVDKDNIVHALYVRTTGPQVFYRTRVGGSWGSDGLPSTETLTKGTKVSGTFSEDVQWEDSAFIQYREARSFQAKFGSFNVGTGVVGTTVPVTGVGLQPDVVIFWWSGRTEATDTASSTDHKRGFGVAVTPTDRRSVFSQSDDGAAVAAADAGHRDDAAIGALAIDGTIDGLADLQSMDTDGFTLVIDDQFATNLRVHYLALGGVDLTNAVTGMFTEPASTGTQDITSVGFQPDAVLLFSGMIGADPPGTAVDSTMMIGVAAGATPANAVWAAASNDGSDPTVAKSYGKAGESIALFNAGITATDGRADVTSWLSNGFRLNWAERAGSRRIHYLALKGGQYLVGDLLTRTDTTTPIVESGFGFTPAAVLIGGSTQAENAADTPSLWDEWSLGAFTSATERGAQGTEDKDALATADVGTQIEFDEVHVDQGNTPGTTEALMDVQSVDADGFTLIMDDADDLVGFVWYLAFGGYAVMDVRYDWSGVPSGTPHTLTVKAYRDDENFLVQVLTPPSTWNTRITISATSNSLHQYTLTVGEYNSGSPSIRFLDANSLDGSLSNLYLDVALVAAGNPRQLVDISSDNPTLVVRAPNDITYGTTPGGLYWKTTTSETYFYYIPEFDSLLLPVIGALALGLVYRRTRRGRQLASPRGADLAQRSAGIDGNSD